MKFPIFIHLYKSLSRWKSYPEGGAAGARGEATIKVRMLAALQCYH
jgi:hypothetical protein